MPLQICSATFKELEGVTDMFNSVGSQSAILINFWYYVGLLQVNRLGGVLKAYVDELRRTPNRKVELVFLIDNSASVGAEDFQNELKFVRKLLADFTVDQNTTRVAVVTFSSKGKVEFNQRASKHGAFTQYCFNVGPASKTVGQHRNSIC